MQQDGPSSSGAHDEIGGFRRGGASVSEEEEEEKEEEEEEIGSVWTTGCVEAMGCRGKQRRMLKPPTGLRSGVAAKIKLRNSFEGPASVADEKDEFENGAMGIIAVDPAKPSRG